MTVASRLFLALLPSDEVRHECEKAARELAIKMNPGGRYVAPAKYHLTLLFLGNALTSEQQFAALQAAAQAEGDPFTLRLDNASSFSDAQVWWLGPREVPPSLASLRVALQKRVNAAGLSPERNRFVPHVTVMRTPHKLPPTLIRPIEWAVTDFVLIRSMLLPQGSLYEEIGRWPLKGILGKDQDQMSLW